MVSDKEKAIQIKELMETILEAIPELMRMLEERSLEEFYNMTDDIKAAFIYLKKAADVENDDEIYKEVSNIITNCIVSLERILQYVKYNREKAKQKIEFELWPFIRYMHVRFYFFSLIYPDEEKMKSWYACEGNDLCKNYYVEEAEKIGKYKYDVSIFVNAYNKLDYTKLCVERILQNLPKDLKCELILCNNGSSDGTKQFYESVCPTKQFDVAINRAGTGAVWYTFEGKYIFMICNDVLITPNIIEIMYEAFEEQNDYAFAVPMTSNICNIQVPIKLNNGNKNRVFDKYNTIEELNEFAKQINVRDINKEEVRYRLCDPLAFLRNKYVNLTDRPSLRALEMTQTFRLAFPDDFRSMYFRRSGYKNILMKDLYAHHFGSVTIGEENIGKQKFNKGRREFLERNGIDPWGRGFCWTFELFDSILCDKADSECILGINCGMGSDILKIQQEIKENTGNRNVKIYTMTDNEKHISDLEAISDKAIIHKGWDDILKHLGDQYDYILVDEKIEECDYKNILPMLYGAVKDDGMLIVYIPRKCNDISEWIMDTYVNVENTRSFERGYEIDNPDFGKTVEIGAYYYLKK